MSKAPGRTYKYYTGEPLFKFGYGLSYTDFELTTCSVEPSAKGALPKTVACQLRNVGDREGDEVVMMYHSASEEVRAQAKHPVPISALVNFQRATIAAGQSTAISFIVGADELNLIDENGEPRRYAGSHNIILSLGHGEDVT